MRFLGDKWIDNGILLVPRYSSSNKEGLEMPGGVESEGEGDGQGSTVGGQGRRRRFLWLRLQCSVTSRSVACICLLLTGQVGKLRSWEAGKLIWADQRGDEG